MQKQLKVSNADLQMQTGTPCRSIEPKQRQRNGRMQLKVSNADLQMHTTTHYH